MRRLIRKPPRNPRSQHGQCIYAYCNPHTNQVLYSLTQDLDPHHSPKQLPDSGANNNPPHLRKDHWRPLFSLSLPTPPQGLHAYRKLREWRKLHETHWTPPRSFSQPKTEAQLEKLQERLEERGGSKKESVYDLIKREKKRVRMRGVMDQKANSVADLAAVLREQEVIGEGRRWGQVEEEVEGRRSEVGEMVRLAEEAGEGGMGKLEEEGRFLEAFVAGREEDEVVVRGRREGWSKRKAGMRLEALRRERERMDFAVVAVAEAQPEWRRARLEAVKREDEERFRENLVQISKAEELPQRIRVVRAAMKAVLQGQKANGEEFGEKLRGLHEEESIAVLEGELRLAEAPFRDETKSQEMLDRKSAMAALESGGKVTNKGIQDRIAGLTAEESLALLDREMRESEAELRDAIREVRIQETQAAISALRYDTEVESEEVRAQIQGLQQDEAIAKLEGELKQKGEMRTLITEAREGLQDGTAIQRIRTSAQELEDEIAALEDRVTAAREYEDPAPSDVDRVAVLKERLGMMTQLVSRAESRDAYVREIGERWQKGRQLLAAFAAEKLPENREALSRREKVAEERVAEIEEAIGALRRGEQVVGKEYAREVADLQPEEGVERLKGKKRKSEAFIPEAREARDRGLDATRLRIGELDAEILLLKTREAETAEKLSKEEESQLTLLKQRKSANAQLIKNIDATDADLHTYNSDENTTPQTTPDLTDLLPTTPLTLRDYILHLPHFPPHAHPNLTALPKTQRSALLAAHKRQNTTIYTTENVKIKWDNILDAEFAESWPENVEHESMGFHKNNKYRAPDPRVEAGVVGTVDEVWEGIVEAKRVRRVEKEERRRVQGSARGWVERVGREVGKGELLGGLGMVRARGGKEVKV